MDAHGSVADLAECHGREANSRLTNAISLLTFEAHVFSEARF